MVFFKKSDYFPQSLHILTQFFNKSSFVKGINYINAKQ
ncbi:MAG: Unknown protein [uncultured Sulfurovum sp.]|uniref:Uncharacterized protein n=1 Tax=uncultured Sulfurovum sp. TaxID=269237 RepID=A0A6S6T946_9BACT|nr:MAG: Unknown protein [uncultured Sulfurovum sp.]